MQLLSGMACGVEAGEIMSIGLSYSQNVIFEIILRLFGQSILFVLI
jgi:hypothetical protein